MPQINARACLGSHDVLFITIDSLRYDVAQHVMGQGRTPNLQKIAPGDNWQKRHTPSSFTFGAHMAFFAGFLPTQVTNPSAKRLFATRFPGSRSVDDNTLLFNQADIITGFADAGYRTICIGGVGFFNKQSALGSTLPNLFNESWWSESMGVNCLQSTENQVRIGCERLAMVPREQRAFFFLNISACHFPNRGYCKSAAHDSAETQGAALAYVDTQLAPLVAAMRARAPVLTIICSDHGEAYGEDGYTGHRVGHSTVWDVPYVETILPAT